MPSASRSVRGMEQRRFLSSSLSLCVFIDLLFISAPSRCYARHLSLCLDSLLGLILLLISTFRPMPSRRLHWRNLSKGKKKKRRVDFFGRFLPHLRLLSNFVFDPKATTFCWRKLLASRRKSCSSSTHQSVLVEIFMTKFSPSFRVIDR